MSQICIVAPKSHQKQCWLVACIRFSGKGNAIVWVFRYPADVIILLPPGCLQHCIFKCQKQMSNSEESFWCVCVYNVTHVYMHTCIQYIYIYMYTYILYLYIYINI